MLLSRLPFVTRGHRVPETRRESGAPNPTPRSSRLAHHPVNGPEGGRGANGSLVGSTEPESVEKLLVHVVDPVVRGDFVVLEGDQLEVEHRRDRCHAAVRPLRDVVRWQVEDAVELAADET